MREFSVYLDGLHAVFVVDPANKFDYCEFKDNPVEICVHHTGDAIKTVEEVYAEGVKNYRQPMYHFVIDKHGKIYQMLPINVMGSHTVLKDEKSFGIALLNVVSPSSITDAMRYSLQALISHLSKKYPIKSVKTHFDVHIEGITDVLEKIDIGAEHLFTQEELESLSGELTKDNVETFKRNLKEKVDLIDVEDLIKTVLVQRIESMDNCPGTYVLKGLELNSLLEETLKSE